MQITAAESTKPARFPDNGAKPPDQEGSTDRAFDIGAATDVKVPVPTGISGIKSNKVSVSTDVQKKSAHLESVDQLRHVELKDGTPEIDSEFGDQRADENGADAELGKQSNTPAARKKLAGSEDDRSTDVGFFVPTEVSLRNPDAGALVAILYKENVFQVGKTAVQSGESGPYVESAHPKPLAAPNQSAPVRDFSSHDIMAPSTADISRNVAPRESGGPETAIVVADVDTVNFAKEVRDRPAGTPIKDNAGTPIKHNIVGALLQQADTGASVGDVSKPVLVDAFGEHNSSSLVHAALAGPHANIMHLAAEHIRPPHVSPAPAPAIRQITTAIARISDGKAEVRLDPPELGRVTISISHSESGVTAHIVAEKPDVADFLRRSADIFARELTRSGFANPTLDFSHGQHQEQERGDRVVAFGPGIADGAMSDEGDELAAVFAPTGLDIRI